MLYAAKEVWSAIQDFMKRISSLEGDRDETKKEMAYLKRELDVFKREVEHEQEVTAKVSEHHGKKVAELEARIKALEKKNHSLATTAGIAKTKLEKMKDDEKGPKGRPKGPKGRQ